jgi:serine/threonine protein kinase/WD40 repeat protein
LSCEQQPEKGLPAGEAPVTEPSLPEESILLQALEIACPAGRAAFLDRACGENGNLRAEVEALLRAHAQSGDLLDLPDKPAVTVEESSRERPGTVIGPYKLLQQIGEGGMGTVFMAEQQHPVRRKVALKVIKAGMDSAQVIARFEAERQALALMDHVNIARVFDGGTTESGRPYFVMELVHGVPITQYCDDNRLTPRERLELFVPACQAVQHAHQKGVIHRDLKPSNILVTMYDGKPVPKVIDFGVAKATEQKLTERTLFTQYGTLVGTLEYMSPEQAEMSALGVDTRSDIFSLGVLLYELLTGSTPLSHKRVKAAAYAEVLRMIRDEEPPRPSTRLSDSGETLASISANRHTEPAKLAGLLRGELDWIVMKTLEKDRSRRYETANGLAMDLKRYLSDEPVLACPPSAMYRLRKLVRRNKRILATVGLVALTLVAGTVVSTLQAIRATEAEGLARTRLQAETEAQNATRQQLRLTEEAQEQATRRLYDARLAQARAGSLSRRVGQRFDSLDALAEAAKIARDLNLPEQRLLELRNAAIACLALPDLRIAKEWNGFPTGSLSVGFDGTLKRYARVDRQGVVHIHQVGGDTEICRLPGMGPGQAWAWFSPDGQFLALAHQDDRIKVWKLAGSEAVVLVEELSAPGGVAFSPDSRRLAIGHADGSLRLYELPSGRQLKQLEGVPRHRGLAFHPEGRQLAVCCATGVQIYDLETGRIFADLPQPPGADCVAWHPGGKTLAVNGGDRIIHIWDVDTRSLIARLEGHKADGIYFAYNHAGDLLASTGWDGTMRLWDPRTGRQLFKTEVYLASLGFSPDDRFLTAGVADTKLRIWELAGLSAYRTLVGGPVPKQASHYTGCALSPNGRLLALTQEAGVSFWDLARRKELAFTLIGNTRSVVFESSDALLTGGPAGSLRWPIQENVEAPGLLRIGPPTRLLPFWGEGIACSSDGRVLTSPQGNGALVLDQDHPDRPIRLTCHRDVRFTAVSPDGRWVATGSHWDTKVKVWAARTGKLEKELPVETGSMVGFSPDGRWLATTGGGLALWEVGSWRPGKQIGGGVFAFSPDCKLLAVEAGHGVIRLVNPDSGQEYARLEDPNQESAFRLCFSPDGAQLIAPTQASQSVHVWDLRTIREQLVRMGLDWELPPYPSAEPDDGKSLRVEIHLGVLGAKLQAHEYLLQGYGYCRSKQWDKSMAAYARAIELDPKIGGGLNNLAWLLLTCPDAKLRDPGRAAELAARASQLTPLDGHAWNTLGVAQYRAGDWQAAVVALAKSDELLGEKDLSFNAFFLAMAHWQLGKKEEARSWMDRAVRWMDKNKPQDEQLRRIRDEAEQLLGTKK